VQIVFDPAVIFYETLMEVFWFSHDPTQRDRQGNDVGPQYRSVIFYYSEEQRIMAQEYKQEIDEQRLYPAPAVTEIVPAGVFYPADRNHISYFNNNGSKPYCSVFIEPKVREMKRLFADLMMG
jgi:peptide-methionine (S)-S-oxide reductase